MSDAATAETLARVIEVIERTPGMTDSDRLLTLLSGLVLHVFVRIPWPSTEQREDYLTRLFDLLRHDLRLSDNPNSDVAGHA